MLREKPTMQQTEHEVVLLDELVPQYQSESTSTTRRMVERHVWQDALDAITAFTKTHNGKRIGPAAGFLSAAGSFL